MPAPRFNEPPPDLFRAALWRLTQDGGVAPHRVLAGWSRRVAFADLVAGTAFETDMTALDGRSVLVRTSGQLPAVLALLELDGIARRVVLAPPDLAPAHLEQVLTTAAIDAVISDDPAHDTIICQPGLHPRPPRPAARHDTEWVLFTSGTTGAPKLVAHTLPALTGPIGSGPKVPDASHPVWSTFYDVRRYGGLQILLRALLGGGSMVLSDAAEPVGDFLARAGAEGVTHISGTPSHWRRALMSGHARRMQPAYVRLSGEIADQALLDRLQEAYPDARVTHAFASTEAGVAFDVTDGRAGFPAAWIGTDGSFGPLPGIELRVVDDTLRIRSRRIATGYLDHRRLADPDGYVDTGDIVEREGDRFLFRGRVGGIINVGGQKVYPEEVEAVLNAHPAVLAARVRARPNAITGAVVTADIVLREGAPRQLGQEILQQSRNWLAPHKVPALVRVVAALDVLPSGKLARHAG